MQLFYRKTGEGQPLIILHGLLGSSDNWQSFAKNISTHGFSVYTIDLRNHGQSPHSEIFTYEAMSNDVLDFITDHSLQQPVLLGHSLGGKVVMHLALNHPGKVGKMIVSDMAPRNYPPHHSEIIAALKSIPLDRLKSRKEVEEMLATKLDDAVTRQFLLKSLYWQKPDQLGWRFNLEVIGKELEQTGKEIKSEHPFTGPVLFIRGERSNYIRKEDEAGIKALFTNVEIMTAPGAGHWVHADNPSWMAETVLQFLQPGQA